MNAWGTSWGSAWGTSFGSTTAAPPPPFPEPAPGPWLGGSAQLAGVTPIREGELGTRALIVTIAALAAAGALQ